MKEIALLLERYPALKPMETEIEKAYKLLENSYAAGGKLLICGNGGSSADSEHIVGELMKDFCLPRSLPEAEKKTLAALPYGEKLASGLHGALPAISLTSQTALMTALVNDGDPALVFAQQVWGYGREGDVLLALSTSGNSQNIVCAASAAKARGMRVLAITGAGGGKLKEISDVALCLPEKETYKVQELTLPIYHALCLALENRFFGT